jgi:hypothetical protein
MALTFPKTSFVPIRIARRNWQDRRDRQTVNEVGPRYQRLPASEYTYKPSRLSPWLANFYGNAIHLALAVGSRDLPVDFETLDGRAMYLDRGCIKMAEYAGFIEKLKNDRTGIVTSIRLSWRVS